jgi:hypothetical protein
MSTIIIAVIVILLFVVAILMMIRYAANKTLMCPHCQLEFATDLFLIQDNGLLGCPFCHRWIIVRKTFDKYVTKKLFA